MQLDAYHQKMRDLFVAELRELIAGKQHSDVGEIDELLNACPSGCECCDQCAEIFCPYGELLHFHHDGCPCCEMAPFIEDRNMRHKARIARWGRLLSRNTRSTTDATGS